MSLKGPSRYKCVMRVTTRLHTFVLFVPARLVVSPPKKLVV